MFCKENSSLLHFNREKISLIIGFLRDDDTMRTAEISTQCTNFMNKRLSSTS